MSGQVVREASGKRTGTFPGSADARVMDLMDTMCPLSHGLAAEERTAFAGEPADQGLHVAVVHANQAVRHGLVRLLADDQRLHLMDPVARISQLRTSGLSFDVCLVGLPEADAADEFTVLVTKVPCVVWTSARHWRPWVAPWVWGARDVVGDEVGRVPLADAVWGAVADPGEMHPQLAGAIIAGVSASGLPLSPALTDVLSHVAEGRRVRSALSLADTSVADYVAGLTALRAAFGRAGLGVLSSDEGGRPGIDEKHAFEPSLLPPEALMLSSRVREVLRYYADGYDYEEIAQILTIRESTVKTHVLAAMDKFGIIANRTSEVRLLLAMYVSGRHRKPDLIRRRLENLKNAVPQYEK
jgi:DNA-binding CsgD family transcriptional regulator